jgi:hypothetical protein
VHWAPGIPHALCWAELNAQLGRIAPRECEAISQRHCEEQRDEAIQLSPFLAQESWIASLALAMTVLAV